MTCCINSVVMLSVPSLPIQVVHAVFMVQMMLTDFHAPDVLQVPANLNNDSLGPPKLLL